MKYTLLIIVGLIIALLTMVKQVEYANNKWKVSESNVKAYAQQLSDSKGNIRALKLSIDQLNTFQDSVLVELNNTRKELGIKDKALKSLQKSKVTYTKGDTIILRDTIFKSPFFKRDTLIGDAWYSIHVSMEYPSTITIKPEFKSEKDIIVSTRKETVNPPKKFFLFRWFQKKHIVTQVNVIEKNPYIENQKDNYIEIE